ncbi:hypothetical protein COO60DRAFT_1641921 [Scenedesmus sp. NREL 46B-D3]|nr:hypothetical protein COO60DRAFT_1641921 [Scenedesmus sp. NREL 46B-D3]
MARNKAYRTLARRLHPDKGGSSEAFGALQAAFELLSDPKARRVYDALAADVRFRPGAAAPYSQVRQPDAEPGPPPGATEALLLQQLLRARAAAGCCLDPAVQLCVTCEVCRRPATKECWTCRMPICDFCTRRQHWKGDVPLHWPLVDSPGRLLQQLGQQELEAKRKEDGAAYLASLPGYRPQHDVKVLRQFQDAILDLLKPQQQQQQQQQRNNSSIAASFNNGSSITRALVSTTTTSTTLATAGSSSGKGVATIGSSNSINKCWRAWQAADPALLRQLQGQYHARLAQFYMWTQTDEAVLLAVHMPTAAWAGAIDPAGGVSSWAAADGRTVALMLPKAQAGQAWGSCFKARLRAGDSHGARCLTCPYSLLQLPHEVQLELPLPFWVVPEEDLQVHIGERGVSIAVDGLLRLQRTYWTAAEAKSSSRKVVDVAASSWCVLEDQQPPGRPAAAAAAAGSQLKRRPGKLLSVTLAVPEPTGEEVQYKKGVRQNNAAATRNSSNGNGKLGYAFFADDEDEFGLASLLHAMLFHQMGESTLSPSPWDLAAGVAGLAGDDKYMQHGQLLLAVQQSPVPLERLLAVAKLAVSFLTDLLRPSNDTQDIPILILGHHYISHRQLAAAPAAAAAAAAAGGGGGPPTGPAAPPPAGAAAAASGAGGGASYTAYLQEVCTFDSNEGPKSFTGVEGVPLALLDLSLEPMAVAKSKRLGRELSIKVGLNPSSGGSRLQLLSWGEEYSLSWPALQLLAPTSPRCPAVFKGELAISCRATGLLMSLTFAKDCSVKGTIEQLPGSAAAAAAAMAAMAAAAAAAAAGGGAGSKVQLLGTVAGHWTSVINVSCPKLGLEGVLYDSAASSPPPLPQLHLAQLGPMRLPRVWSAIHDALLYADPRVAAGGRAASKLAFTMSQYLKALTLDSATSRDVAPSAMVAAHQQPGSTAAASKSLGSSAGRMSSAVSTADTDADLEEFDRMVEGRSQDSQDSRAVPPSYKAQHAEGNKLMYVLHYSLTRRPGSTAAA